MWKEDLKGLCKEPVTTVAVIIVGLLMALSMTIQVVPSEANAQTSNERHRELVALESIARDLKAVRQKLERCDCR